MTVMMTKWRSGEWRGGLARPDKATRRRPERRPGIEVLEDRACPSLSLSLPVLAGTVGTPYSQQVQITGNDSTDSYTFSSVAPPGDLTSSGLPTGLTLYSTGMISGTPTAPGSYPITIEVTDTTTGQSAQAAFPLVISPLITASGSMPGGTENASYSSGVITVSGEPGQSFTFAASGNIPPGLNLTTLNGPTTQLTGTPTEWGTYSFSVSATDASGNQGTQAFQVTVSPAVTFSPPPATASLTLDGGPSSQADTVLLSGFAGQFYSQTISVSSKSGISSLTPSTYSWNGLSVSVTASNTVIIRGTPTTFTNSTIQGSTDPLELTVTATDGGGFSDATTYQLNVEPAPASSIPVAVQVDFAGANHDDFSTVDAGQPFTATFVTPAGTGTFQFALMNRPSSEADRDSVPKGMSFDATSATLRARKTIIVTHWLFCG